MDYCGVLPKAVCTMPASVEYRRKPVSRQPRQINTTVNVALIRLFHKPGENDDLLAANPALNLPGIVSHQ